MNSLRIMQSDADGAVTLGMSARGLPLGEPLSDWELQDLIKELLGYRDNAVQLRTAGTPDRTGRLMCEGCRGAISIADSKAGIFRHLNPYDASVCELSFPVPVNYQDVMSDQMQTEADHSMERAFREFNADHDAEERGEFGDDE
jgi:hypothetical protein